MPKINLPLLWTLLSSFDGASFDLLLTKPKCGDAPDFKGNVETATFPSRSSEVSKTSLFSNWDQWNFSLFFFLFSFSVVKVTVWRLSLSADGRPRPWRALEKRRAAGTAASLLANLYAFSDMEAREPNKANLYATTPPLPRPLALIGQPRRCVCKYSKGLQPFALLTVNTDDTPAARTFKGRPNHCRLAR